MPRGRWQDRSANWPLAGPWQHAKFGDATPPNSRRPGTYHASWCASCFVTLMSTFSHVCQAAPPPCKDGQNLSPQSLKAHTDTSHANAQSNTEHRVTVGLGRRDPTIASRTGPAPMAPKSHKASAPSRGEERRGRCGAKSRRRPQNGAAAQGGLTEGPGAKATSGRQWQGLRDMSTARSA